LLVVVQTKAQVIWNWPIRLCCIKDVNKNGKTKQKSAAAAKGEQPILQKHGSSKRKAEEIGRNLLLS